MQTFHSSRLPFLGTIYSVHIFLHTLHSKTPRKLQTSFQSVPGIWFLFSLHHQFRILRQMYKSRSSFISTPPLLETLKSRISGSVGWPIGLTYLPPSRCVFCPSSVSRKIVWVRLSPHLQDRTATFFPPLCSACLSSVSLKVDDFRQCKKSH